MRNAAVSDERMADRVPEPDCCPSPSSAHREKRAVLDGRPRLDVGWIATDMAESVGQEFQGEGRYRIAVGIDLKRRKALRRMVHRLNSVDGTGRASISSVMAGSMTMTWGIIIGLEKKSLTCRWGS